MRRILIPILLVLLVVLHEAMSYRLNLIQGRGFFVRHRGTCLQAVKENKAVGDKVVTVDVLKNIELTNYKGEKTRISSVIKSSDKAVVVFLRHLG